MLIIVKLFVYSEDLCTSCHSCSIKEEAATSTGVGIFDGVYKVLIADFHADKVFFYFLISSKEPKPDNLRFK